MQRIVAAEMPALTADKAVYFVAAMFIGIDKGGIPGFAAVGMTLILGIHSSGYNFIFILGLFSKLFL